MSITPDDAALLSLLFDAAQAVGVLILVYQVYDARVWRQKESAYNFAEVGDTASLQERLYVILKRFADYEFPERCVPLQPDHVERIAADPEATFVLNTFLNYLQNVCTAHDLGLVSERSFKVIHAGRVVWWYRVLRPYVAHRRISYANADIWQVFQDTAAKLEEHYPRPQAQLPKLAQPLMPSTES